MVVVPSDSTRPKRDSRVSQQTVDCELAKILIDRLPQPSLVLDDRRRIVVLNEAMAELLGCTRDELAWQDFVDCITESQLGAAMSAVDQVSCGAEPRRRVRFSPRRRLELMIELELEGVRSGESILTLGTVSPDAPLPFETLTVEVSTKGEHWGRILRGADSEVSDGDARSPGCCRVLCGQPGPCDACPAVAVSEKEPNASRVIEIHESEDQYVVITARRLDANRVSMSRVRLDESTRSRLAEARLDSVAKRAGLSSRERQVLSYLLMGLEIRDIAELLGIAVRTVRFHQYNLLEKLGAESRADLVRFIL
jgi:DNA-binding CsgD family transcriptional regulator